MDFSAALRRVTKWPPISTSFLVPQEAPPPPDPLAPYAARPFKLDLQLGDSEPGAYERGSLYAPSRDPRNLRRRQ